MIIDIYINLDDVNISSEYVKSSSTESIQSDQTDSKSLLNETTEKKSSGDSIDGLDLTSNGLPRKQICTLDDHPIRAGCTAVVGVLVGNELIVANAEDSRAVICRAGGGAEALSFDHKPSHEIEKNRVLAAGGFVNSFESPGYIGNYLFEGDAISLLKEMYEDVSLSDLAEDMEIPRAMFGAELSRDEVLKILMPDVGEFDGFEDGE